MIKTTDRRTALDIVYPNVRTQLLAGPVVVLVVPESNTNHVNKA